jgi:hypothetical protein
MVAGAALEHKLRLKQAAQVVEVLVQELEQPPKWTRKWIGNVWKKCNTEYLSESVAVESARGPFVNGIRMSFIVLPALDCI